MGEAAPSPENSQRTARRHGAQDVASAWELGTLAGRLTELSGGASSAVLSLALWLVGEAQRRGEPAGWITGPGSCFFPPDAAASGVDLEALVVVRVPPTRAPWVADVLLRSGGFGLVVIDLGPWAHVPLPIQTRLAGLARKHRAALVFLTEKPRGTEKPSDSPSLGPMISLRLEATRTRRSRDAASRERFGCEVRILKDKRSGFASRCGSLATQEVNRAPDGLC